MQIHAIVAYIVRLGKGKWKKNQGLVFGFMLCCF